MYESVIAPSILSADFSRLADEVATVDGHVDMLHVDVMDGHYVPNITIGPPVVRSLRAATTQPLDCHLMITDPRTYAPQFIELGAESVTFHPEVDDDPASLIEELHERGGLVGVAIKPAHPVHDVLELLPLVDLLLVMTVEPGFGGQAFMDSCVTKVAEADQLRRDHGWKFRLQVDGGIDPLTIGSAVAAGADTFVAGSSVFARPDRPAAVAALRDAVGAASRRGRPGAASKAGGAS
ncbi:MAG: ribulose-phosphate 3-epimerase [Nitriliruptoraceae bacterium]